MVIRDVVQAGVEAVSIEGQIDTVHHEVLLGAPCVLIGRGFRGLHDELAIADHRHDDDGDRGNGDDQVAAVVLDELFGFAGQFFDVRAVGVVCSHGR